MYEVLVRMLNRHDISLYLTFIFIFIFSGVPIYKFDASYLGCGFALWKIITIGSTVVIVVVVAAIVIGRKWKTIKYHFYTRFTNDDDSQDLAQMEYDAFVSCR